MNRLRERIADLEDEKGNLQLHLVDFDEIQGNVTSVTRLTSSLTQAWCQEVAGFGICGTAIICKYCKLENHF